MARHTILVCSLFVGTFATVAAASAQQPAADTADPATRQAAEEPKPDTELAIDGDDSTDLELAQRLTQPPPRVLRPRTAPTPDTRTRTSPALAARSPLFYRLASVPEMFGDLFAGGRVTGTSVGPPGIATATLPTAGGARRSKIGENNKPFPQDRVFFLYNHFHNAIESDVTGIFLGGADDPDDFSVDRYTFGIEKTFCDGLWSAELRVPFTGRYEAEADGFEVDGGKFGNLSLVFKRLLCASEDTAVAAGLAIDFPTGSDVDGAIGATEFTLNNDSYHLLPYIGMMVLPSERLFVQGFAQLDLPANGNRVESDPELGGGRLDDQTLLYLDLAAGYWLLRDECADCLIGLAPVIELHYTTTLEDTDSVTLVSGAETLEFSNTANRLDVLDLTVGLHAEFAGGLNMRVGAVFPLRDDDDKVFDAEVHVSVNWRF